MPSFSNLTTSVSTVFTETTQKITAALPTSKSDKPAVVRGPAFINLSGGVGNLQGNAGASIVSTKDLILHSTILFFTFLSLCCFAAVAGFQAKYGVGPSGLTGFALFLSVSTFLMSAVLLGIPLIFDKFDKLKGMALFLKVPRTEFVLFSSCAISTLILGISTTVSAFTQVGCKDASLDPSASSAKAGFEAGLPGWCRTKRAGAIFSWFSFGGWVVFLVWSYIAFRRNRGRGNTGAGGGSGQDGGEQGILAQSKERPFSPPETEDFEDTSYETPRYERAGRGEEGDDDEDDRIGVPVNLGERQVGNRYYGDGGTGRDALPTANNIQGAYEGQVPQGYAERAYGDHASSPFRDHVVQPQSHQPRSQYSTPLSGGHTPQPTQQYQPQSHQSQVYYQQPSPPPQPQQQQQSQQQPIYQQPPRAPFAAANMAPAASSGDPYRNPFDTVRRKLGTSPTYLTAPLPTTTPAAPSAMTTTNMISRPASSSQPYSPPPHATLPFQLPPIQLESRLYGSTGAGGEGGSATMMTSSVTQQQAYAYQQHPPPPQPPIYGAPSPVGNGPPGGQYHAPGGWR